MVNRKKTCYANHGRTVQKTHGIKNLQHIGEHDNKKSRKNTTSIAVSSRLVVLIRMNGNTPIQTLI